MAAAQIAIVAALLLPIALAAILVTLVVMDETAAGAPASRGDALAALRTRGAR
jgi:hypothetical protein